LKFGPDQKVTHSKSEDERLRRMRSWIDVQLEDGEPDSVRMSLPPPVVSKPMPSVVVKPVVAPSSRSSSREPGAR